MLAGVSFSSYFSLGKVSQVSTSRLGRVESDPFEPTPAVVCAAALFRAFSIQFAMAFSTMFRFLLRPMSIS